MITLLNMDWGWSEIGQIALIGFLLVLSILVVLVFVMKLFSRAFSLWKRTAEVAPVLKPMISDEEVAAITIALKMYTSEKHDKESDVITIMSIKRAYSPWSSKIHGLTQLPLRK